MAADVAGEDMHPRAIRKPSKLADYVIEHPISAFAETLRGAKIAADLATYEPLLRAGADHEIVTTAPVLEVVEARHRRVELASVVGVEASLKQGGRVVGGRRLGGRRRA